ncbi:MAG: LysR family transcriptional regulator [Jatrophihabitans sp.]|uniref:LysR family transcriptional regulator n=1 Tax=Jatrophihabitans sp. TaxID=1932789 RepID=UPI003F7F4E6C
MDAHQLAVLREVAEQGSVTGAAKALHCTPSAVSQQLKALETSVGTPLVERVGRGIRVTPAGHELARSAVEVAVALERAAAAVTRFARRPTGTVRIAAFQSAGKMFLPALLTAVAADDGIELVCGEEDVAQTDFVPLTGEYDIVLGHRPDRGYTWGGAGVRVVHLLREPLDIALPPGHPLAGRRTLRPADLAGEPWITVRDEFPVADVVRTIAERSGAPLSVRHRINDFDVTEALVAAGHGIALLPRYTADHRGGTRFALRPLEGVRAGREIDALVRADRAERVVVTRVLRHLRAVARSIVADFRPG